MRIISTVPSQTELLHDLGLEDEVIGITKFCIHPDKWHKKKTKIGGTKNLNIDKIRSLNPDWIISNKEENIREQIESLYDSAQHYTSDVHDIDSAVSMILDIGRITNTEKEAQIISDKILSNFRHIEPITTERKALYLIWKNPYMSIGNDTFIHQMLNKCGWDNCCRDLLRYPVVSIQDITDFAPDDILLSSEPYPFKQKDIEELQKSFPDTNIMLVDGAYFSWYGSRLIKSPEYFIDLINSISKL